MKQKARQMPLHLQEEAGKELEKLMKTGQLEKMKHVDEDCFVSPIVIPVKNDMSIENCIGIEETKRQLYENEHGRVFKPNFGRNHEKPNKEVHDFKNRSRIRIRPDKIVEKTSRQCVFAIIGGKFSGYYRFKKGLYGLADIPTSSKNIRPNTRVFHTGLDDIIVVTRRSQEDHEKKLFDVLKILEDAGYRASEENPSSS